MKKRGPKKKPIIKDHLLAIRTTEKVSNRIKGLAMIYAGGNVNKWLEYAALNAPRKVLR